MTQKRFEILARVSALVMLIIIALQGEIILLGQTGLTIAQVKQCLAHPALLLVSTLFVSSLYIIAYAIGLNRQYLWLGCVVLLMLTSTLALSVASMTVFAWMHGFKSLLIAPWQYYLVYIALENHAGIQSQFFITILLGPVLSILGIMFYIAYHADTSKKPFGHAHFANVFEIFKDGFYKTKGILLGKKFGSLLYAGGDEHVMVFAPSGSGKTSAIAIPNLFNWPGSVVVNDVKGTLYKITSKYRQEMLGNNCYVWAPASLTTHRYNPLSFISDDKIERVKEIQRIAHIFIPDKKGDAFWSQSCREILTTLVLYLLDTDEIEPTLGNINRLVKQQDFDGWLEMELNESNHLDSRFYQNGFSYINTDERTRSSILKSFVGYFELFDDPIVDAATSHSDFDLALLRKQKTSIYIHFNDDDMDRLSPIITIFWQQMISKMIGHVPSKIQDPYDVLCVIDEFSSMGRVEKLRTSLKLLREYRVRCIIMVQYIAQTFEKYSHDEAKAFLNIKTKVAFTPDNIDDAKYISDALGQTTKKVKSTSSSSRANLDTGSKTASMQYQAVPLMRPEEILKLKPGRAIIIKTGCQPVMAMQCAWYKESNFKYNPVGAISIPILEPKDMKFIHSKANADEVSGDSLAQTNKRLPALQIEQCLELD